VNSDWSCLVLVMLNREKKKDSLKKKKTLCLGFHHVVVVGDRIEDYLAALLIRRVIGKLGEGRRVKSMGLGKTISPGKHKSSDNGIPSADFFDTTKLTNQVTITHHTTQGWK